jgi:electron transport complex protein RnfB
MDPVLMKLAILGLIVLGTIGLFFGIGLALAAHRFAVEANPKVEEVLESLAGAQCGGCGYAGCEAYAEAVVNDPSVPPNLCFPGGAEVAEMVAELTGKKMTTIEDTIAAIRCSKIEGKVKKKQNYVGHISCAAAELAFGGPMACNYACIGLGDCAEACPFDAITMVGNYPVVDAEACVGCGTCVRTCPKGIIELSPMRARVWVPCSTKDSGKTVRQLCKVGCIACGMCVKVCPADAVSIEDNIVRIDHKKCIAYGPDCGEVCVEKCPRKIFRYFQPKEKTRQKMRKAAA